MWKINNTFLNNQWAKEEITREIRKYFEIMNVKTQHANTYEIQLWGAWRGIYSYKCLY